MVLVRILLYNFNRYLNVLGLRAMFKFEMAVFIFFKQSLRCSSGLHIIADNQTPK